MTTCRPSPEVDSTEVNNEEGRGGENGLIKEHRQKKEYKESFSLHLTMSLTPIRY